jgi:tRNA pseudouridine13 synthase
MINYTIDLSLPYATEGQPGIGGRLRSKPQHFEVYEIPLYDASGEGEHLYVNITKVGLTTKQVQTDLARLFGLKKSQVGFAGLKDKHAQTTQTFSLGVGHKDPAYAGEAAARIEDQLDVEVNWARFHRNKLKTGHLLGNRFSIVVSNPECDPDTCFERCTSITQLIVERGIPNYFGPQRFGRNGSNVEQGLGILGGSVSHRDKWLRKFLVGSVQSYLCNLYLAERFNTGHFDSLIAGDVAKKYETGGMFAVEDLPVDQLRYEAHEISFTAPV